MPQKRVAQRRRHRGVERGERKPGRVGRDDRIAARGCGPMLRVEIALPVEPLGDRLDHEVAVGEAREIVVVVGDLDRRRELGHAERRRLELRQARDAPCGRCRCGRRPWPRGRTGTTRTPALTRCAAICAPITPAPSTATSRTTRRAGPGAGRRRTGGRRGSVCNHGSARALRHTRRARGRDRRSRRRRPAMRCQNEYTICPDTMNTFMS